MTDEPRTLAEQWLAADPDPETRDELSVLLAEHPDEIVDRFSERLTFGTAGLRGPLGAGPARMNRVLVRMAASALADVLDEYGDPAGGVAVGFDARRKSDLFAHDTARVLAARDIPVHLLDQALPTPLLAFTVAQRGCSAGVMVTASHNPPADNGYKVYWSDGAQIVPPVDSQIEQRIAATPPLTDELLADLTDPHISRIDVPGQVSAYLDDVIGPPRPPRPSPKTVYTALHGVGGEMVAAAFARAGFPAPAAVAEQQEPDGSFPTVVFPNPEEPGAMDLVLDLARREDADLVVANDPDADRLAVAVRDPSPGGGYRQLTGDEVGVLLGDRRIAQTSGEGRLVANSLVSSGMLGEIARASGVRHRDTLTGFKWIMRTAADEPDAHLVFGYEEALGYAISPAVRDKDGISAAVAVVELACDLATDGRTLLDRLDELAATHGVHVTAQVSPRFDDDPGRIAGLMDRLRRSPPNELAGSPVESVEDFLTRTPPADLLRWRTARGDRIIVRPSGTEAKVKCYLEVTAGVDDNDLAAARRYADARLEELTADVESLLGAE